MKYIRTKDGIYESAKQQIVKRYDSEGNLFATSIDTSTNSLISIYEDIIKQADTIEELCDELVVIPYADEPCQKIRPQNDGFHNVKELLKFYDDNMTGVFSLYGAIWTDKGLIYVAKMNEEGELELL